MKLKEAAKYRYSEFSEPAIIYYSVVLAIYISTLIVNINTNYTGFMYSFIATIVFLAVLSFVYYFRQFKMMVQNGISRRTIHNSFLLFLPIAFIMSLSDNIINTLFALMSGKYESLSQIVYTNNMVMSSAYFEVPGSSRLYSVFVALIQNTALYALALAVGYFLACLFYRLKPIARVIMAVAVPGLISLFVVYAEALPQTTAVNKAYMLGGRFLVSFLFGVNFHLSITVSSIILTVLLLSIAHLIIQKTEIKN